MIFTMGLLALDLGEEDAEQAAGALVGFYDEDRSSHLLLRAVVVYEVAISLSSLVYVYQLIDS